MPKWSDRAPRLQMSDPSPTVWRLPRWERQKGSVNANDNSPRPSSVLTHDNEVLLEEQLDANIPCECDHRCDDNSCRADHRCGDPAVWLVSWICVEPGCDCAATGLPVCDACHQTIAREYPGEFRSQPL